MKMTKEQVAELLLKANEDLSNVECLHSDGWKKPGAKSIAEMLDFIVDNNDVYRIKDNAVKEVTEDLLLRKCNRKSTGTKSIITAVNKNQVYMHNGWHTLDEFNEQWQLVED